MPPRGFTNPAPKTESAREARKSFYCELCSKGYARMNEFEAHEGSYDHLHKKRLKEMKQMSRDPTSRAKALRAERRADEKSGLGVITIKPVAGGGGGGMGSGFRKGGFRNAFGEGDEGGKGGGDEGKDEEGDGWKGKGEGDGVGVDGDGEEEDGSVSEEGEYDPRFPTGCGEGCRGRGE